MGEKAQQWHKRGRGKVQVVGKNAWKEGEEAVTACAMTLHAMPREMHSQSPKQVHAF